MTVTVPASAADADGDPVAGFTYQWVQTDSAGNAVRAELRRSPTSRLTPVAGTPRSATFIAPAFTAAGATLFFRLTVNDGFGATVQSTNLTVALTNTAPTVQFAIRPKQMARDQQHDQRHDRQPDLHGPGGHARRDAEPGAERVDRPTPTARPAFTYLWRNVTTSGGNTNCSTNCIFGGTTAHVDAAPSRCSRCRPSAVRQFFMRLTVTDQFGTAATTINFTINRLANTAPTVTATGPAFVTQGTTGVAAHRHRNRPADLGEPGRRR